MKKNIILALMLSVASFLSIGQTINQGKDYSIHEFRISIGDPLIQMHHVNGLYSSGLSFSNLFQLPEYEGQCITSLPVTIGYRFRPLKWLWIGGDLTYYHFWGKEKNSSQGDNISAYMISLDFAIRFSYLNKEKVTLYSELTYNLIGYHPGMSRMPPHCTLLGVNTGGKHWFGSFEFGYGYKGLFNVGFGYRF